MGADPGAHRDADRGHVRIRRAVIGLEREAVRADVAGGRRVRDDRRGSGQASVRRIGDDGIRERRVSGSVAESVMALGGWPPWSQTAPQPRAAVHGRHRDGTVATFESCTPSLALNVKLSGPL